MELKEILKTAENFRARKSSGSCAEVEIETDEVNVLLEIEYTECGHDDYEIAIEKITVTTEDDEWVIEGEDYELSDKIEHRLGEIYWQEVYDEYCECRYSDYIDC